MSFRNLFGLLNNQPVQPAIAANPAAPDAYAGPTVMGIPAGLLYGLGRGISAKLADKDADVVGTMFDQMNSFDKGQAAKDLIAQVNNVQGQGITTDPSVRKLASAMLAAGMPEQALKLLKTSTPKA